MSTEIPAIVETFNNNISNTPDLLGAPFDAVTPINNKDKKGLWR